MLMVRHNHQEIQQNKRLSCLDERKGAVYSVHRVWSVNCFQTHSSLVDDCLTVQQYVPAFKLVS